MENLELELSILFFYGCISAIGFIFFKLLNELFHHVTGCPEGDWVADGSKCYLVVEYYKSRPTRGMSWDEANEVTILYCVSMQNVAPEISYVSESRWKGCMFPRLAGRAIHATLPSDF